MWENNKKIFEVSAKNAFNVNESFLYIVRETTVHYISQEIRLLGLIFNDEKSIIDKIFQIKFYLLTNFNHQ